MRLRTNQQNYYLSCPRFHYQYGSLIVLLIDLEEDLKE